MLTALLGLLRRGAGRQAGCVRSGVAPLHRQPLHGPTIDQETGKSDRVHGAGVAKRHIYGNAPGVDTAGHAPQAEVSAS